MTEREALNLALDAFGEIAWSNETQWQRDRAKEAITAIKATLEAKDEPAPVAKNEGGRITWMIDDWPQNCLLYTHLPKQEAKDEPVAHQVIAGALFDFMGWLTSRNERLVLSSADNAGPAVEAITEFAKMRGLSLDSARVQDWQDTTPPQRKPLTDEEIENLYFDKFSMGELKAFARAIEAAHGIGE